MPSTVGIVNAIAAMLGYSYVLYEVMVTVLLPWMASDDGWYLFYFSVAITLGIAYLLSAICLVLLLSTPPGSPPKEYIPNDGEVDPFEPGFRLQWCERCENYVPQRAHHCTECKTCVLRYEFHCSTFGLCVGYFNYKAYILYMWNSSCFFCTSHMMFAYYFLVVFILSEEGLSEMCGRDLECARIFAISSVCWAAGVLFTVYHVWAWGAFLANTTWIEIQFYRRFMNKKTALEKKYIEEEFEGRSTFYNEIYNSSSHPEYQPVWPYHIDGDRANISEVMGRSPLTWLIPNGPPTHTNGITFPIHQRWYDLNIIDKKEYSMLRYGPRGSTREPTLDSPPRESATNGELIELEDVV